VTWNFGKDTRLLLKNLKVSVVYNKATYNKNNFFLVVIRSQIPGGEGIGFFESEKRWKFFKAF